MAVSDEFLNKAINRAYYSDEILEEMAKNEYFDQSALQQILDEAYIYQDEEQYKMYKQTSEINRQKRKHRVAVDDIEEVYGEAEQIKNAAKENLNKSKASSIADNIEEVYEKVDNTVKEKIKQNLNNAESAVKKAANDTLKEVVEDSKIFAKLKGAIKPIAGALVLYGLVQTLNDSRGQMSNETLFNPGGPLLS